MEQLLLLEYDFQRGNLVLEFYFFFFFIIKIEISKCWEILRGIVVGIEVIFLIYFSSV